MPPLEIIGFSHDWTFVNADEVTLLYGDKRQRRRVRRKHKLARQKLLDACKVSAATKIAGWVDQSVEKKIMEWASRIPSPMAAEFVREDGRT